MPPPNGKSWFNDIVCDDNVGYLDRFIAGRDPSQQQFSVTSRPKIKIGVENKKAKKFPGTKQLPVNLDDESWIAARKIKFPKMGGPPSTKPEQKDNSEAKIASEIKSKSKEKDPPKRKMTLFEKLI